MTKIEINTRNFSDAMKFMRENIKRDMAEVLNQRAFNIAARTMDSLKPDPGQEQSTRAKIKSYLNQQLTQRFSRRKSGKNKGKLIKRGSRANQLVRANLIIQARRSKMGKTGLYGAKMAEAEGRFKTAAQVGVGFLKTPFLPIIKGLHQLVKFKRVKTRWGRISVWPGSDGYGKIKPAKSEVSPSVEISLGWKVSGAPTKVQRMVVPKLQMAFDAEAREMVKHTEEKIKQAADRANAKWRRSTFEK